jgi:elongation factor Ts
MAITAQDVNKLRNTTGAGMMDCKKALDEAAGDFELAIEILRKKGQKVSASRSDRDAKEGAVFAVVTPDKKSAVILELNCETDFVARNQDFLVLGTTIAELALTHNALTPEDARELKMSDGRTVQEHLTDAMGKIGEKIDVSKLARVDSEYVAAYIHPGARVGVLVAFKGGNGADLAPAGKDIAMQIASMHPVAVDKNGVDATLAEKEMKLARETAIAEGKPENMVDKIALGKLEKFYKERTLLNQEFVKDPSINIAEYLKRVQPGLTVESFQRVHLGF